MWQCVAGQVVPGVSKECSGSIFRVKQTKPVWAAWPWRRTNYSLWKCCIYSLQDAASHPGRLTLHQHQTKTSKLTKALSVLLYILSHLLIYVHIRQQTICNHNCSSLSEPHKLRIHTSQYFQINDEHLSRSSHRQHCINFPYYSS